MSTHPLDAVLAGHMCSGCGACAYLGADGGVTMRDVPTIGARPVGVAALPIEVKDRIVAACPGAGVRSPASGRPAPTDRDELLVGPADAIWEGWAADPEVRRRASSGGIVTALAAYCVERLGMRLVVHVGMEPTQPWTNRTITSHDRAGLLANAGSRYAPSSPVEALRLIEEADGPCVFVGKPCDVAAVAELRKQRPALDRNLGAVLSFFCAGTPASAGTLGLASTLGFDEDRIASVRYRGDGWPGRFRVRGRDGQEASLSYDESWGALARRHRQLRCQVCPDGLGELADVTGGDAWHRREESPEGISVVLARTPLGRRLVEGAAEAGYVELTESDAHRVVAAQGLVRRRKLVAARLTALGLLGLPVPRFRGFHLWRAARLIGPVKFVREMGGTLRRGLARGYRRPESSEGP
ncbi:Coenzyme F420 hydrogenase/dehydrogenase, beta subunit C-terminal domain [Tessaracoccus oleiagri]|uniref:Coenzyme F420 hydrogenase subunit beta n=1 Tax=Tessaracoccus oleiagri TaxID=686624 RepID=A0A1G9MUA7_9ACTN|nr:Coenzyme F420 hydrogenase/dehydrogenase, beta subunit C-terminal domain [Tessaracoccus oleiagri]SDL77591.1 coenzyme F420 hydrogenase subunit beta [Tessaracoccus oleiagri]